MNEKKSKTICVTNVHVCMECFDDILYRDYVNNSDLVVPDGRPLVWAQKLLGYKNASQVRGYDLTLNICKMAEKSRIPIGFYGSTKTTLELLASNLKKKFNNIEIKYLFSPPFRLLNERETDKIIADINKSGVKILFVGLGCPKQEIWMAKNRYMLNCILVGVGAAFDFISGEKINAPRWVQLLGMEWFFRLLSEPRRLWKRYLYHNSRFIWYFISQLIFKKI